MRKWGNRTRNKQKQKTVEMRKWKAKRETIEKKVSKMRKSKQKQLK